MKSKFFYLFSVAASIGLFVSSGKAVHADEINNSDQSTVQQTQQDSSQKQDNQQSQQDQQSNENKSEPNNSNPSQEQDKESNDSQSSSSSNEKPKPAPTGKTGWVTKNNNHYYLKNGKALKGLKKINSSWYLFDKNGIMLKDVRKIPNKSHYGYFGKNGKRKFKNTKTKKAYYWIDKQGKITGIKNNAKVICQRPEMPTGCEITAVTMMINFAGKNVTKQQAARIMPRSSNPNKGFIGSPYKEFPGGYWVAPNGVKPVVKHYLGKATNMTNCGLAAIKKKLLRSHLVVAWVGWFDSFSNHAITLTGYHNKTIYYNDPWTGTKRKMSEDTFLRHWALDGHRALSY